MTRDEQRRKAEAFLALHNKPAIFVLANAWDVSSAKIFEIEGFKAIGTTSAGIAATLGYPDGQRMSLDETTEVVRRIVEHIDLPVSADIEAGYADSIEGIVESALRILNVGAVGINLEDGTGDPSQPLCDVTFQVEKIRAIREMAVSENIHLVVNARTDVYLVSDGDSKTSFRDAVERGNVYREAGADCIFVPDVGDLDKKTIARLVNEIDAPVNIIAGTHTPPLAELEEIGVSRVSLGPRPMRAALAFIRKIAQELRNSGTYALMTADALSYAEVNDWFEKDAP
ncbi:MAG: isocitrate lyase/phosphoenolpyruvate mutase family protein [Gemmatimonadota bacterium]|nr:MAG: isocitrate lyase/phosphoenolpyruvate mutase family protein [Gemmatimonadota bacterium]